VDEITDLRGRAYCRYAIALAPLVMRERLQSGLSRNIVLPHRTEQQQKTADFARVFTTTKERQKAL
jgi:hypothetical protein